jgi:hypothetical protein
VSLRAAYSTGTETLKGMSGCRRLLLFASSL